MSTNVSQFEHAVEVALTLSPVDKVRLVEQIMATLAHDLTQDIEQHKPKAKHSLYGLLADLGQAPSADDIDDARREMW